MRATASKSWAITSLASLTVHLYLPEPLSSANDIHPWATPTQWKAGSSSNSASLAISDTPSRFDAAEPSGHARHALAGIETSLDQGGPDGNRDGNPS